MKMKVAPKDRCKSHFETRRGVVRCSKKLGHTASPLSPRHGNETPGHEIAWTTEQEIKV